MERWEIIDVSGNGDCFFEVVAKGLGDNIQNIRNKIADSLSEADFTFEINRIQHLSEYDGEKMFLLSWVNRNQSGGDMDEKYKPKYAKVMDELRDKIHNKSTTKAIKEPIPTSKEPIPTSKEPIPTSIKEPIPTSIKEPIPTSIKEPIPTSIKEPIPTTITMDKYKEFIKSSSFWANEWAIQKIQEIENIKVIIFHKPNDIYELVSCVERWDATMTEFNPQKYICTFLEKKHYQRMTVSNVPYFTRETLPIMAMNEINKCITLTDEDANAFQLEFPPNIALRNVYQLIPYFFDVYVNIFVLNNDFYIDISDNTFILIQPETTQIKVLKERPPNNASNYSLRISEFIETYKIDIQDPKEPLPLTIDKKEVQQFYMTYLRTDCPSPQVCLAIGYHKKEITTFFHDFLPLQKQLWEPIGASSANGFAIKIPYTIQTDPTYNAYAVLKSVIKIPDTNQDNIVYEAIVGKFLNTYIHKYPCFVQTYGLGYHMDYEDFCEKWCPKQKQQDTQPQQEDILLRTLIDIVSYIVREKPVLQGGDSLTNDSVIRIKHNSVMKQHINPITKKTPPYVKAFRNESNVTYDETEVKKIFEKSKVISIDALTKDIIRICIDASCRINYKFCVLTEYIDDSISFYNFIKENKDNDDKKQQYSTFFFQIYYPLSTMTDKFRHMDLHANNILLMNIGLLPSQKYIKLTYTNKISFYTTHIAKMIDYGRSAFCGTKQFTDSFKTIDCKFEFHVPTDVSNNKYDTPSPYENIKGEREKEKEPKKKQRLRPDTSFINSLYGDPKISMYKNAKYSSKNIKEVVEQLMEEMKDANGEFQKYQNEIQRKIDDNNSLYVGELTVYDDGKDMIFVKK